jgi:hypothetical protein
MPNQSNSTKTKTECDPIKDEKSGLMREVGSQAVWSLSSCKPGLHLFINHFQYLNTIKVDFN